MDAKRFLIFLWTGCWLLSCNQREVSAVEIIKVDTNLVSSIIGSAGKPVIDTMQHQDWHFVEHYTSKTDSTESDLAKDSAGRIVAIMQQRHHVQLFAAEYFSNGQIKGVAHLNNEGEATDSATYFYEDGRIKEKGKWLRNSMIGTWKFYGPDGRLKKMVEYDEKGKKLSTKKF